MLQKRVFDSRTFSYLKIVQTLVILESGLNFRWQYIFTLYPLSGLKGIEIFPIKKEVYSNVFVHV